MPVGAQVVPRRSLPGSVVAPVTARDVTGQFLVSGGSAPSSQVGRIPDVALELGEIELQAQWLAVAAERVKRTVLALLESEDRWRGKIFLNIRPARELGNGPIRVVPVRLQGAWSCRVDLPEKIAWKSLIRVLVEAVLLEAASRQAGDRFGQTPLWLDEGLTGLVLADRGRDLIVEGHTALVRNAVKPELLAEARKVLGERPPLLFGELAFPPQRMGTDPATLAMFRASSTLLVHELIADREGRAAMSRFIGLLPNYLNWQVAFLQAYRGRFLSMMDAEKWWAVNSIHVLSRDPAQVWSRPAALTHLESILMETAEIRGTNTTGAARQTIRLPELILNWDRDVQREVIRRKVGQLRSMQAHAPKEVMPLLVEYYRVLQQYEAQRMGFDTGSLRRAELEPRQRVVALTAARRLRELDRQLEELKRASGALPAGPAQRRRNR